MNINNIILIIIFVAILGILIYFIKSPETISNIKKLFIPEPSIDKEKKKKSKKKNKKKYDEESKYSTISGISGISDISISSQLQDSESYL